VFNAEAVIQSKSFSRMRELLKRGLMSTDILLAPTVRILSTNAVLVESSPQIHSHNLSEAELNAYFRSGAFTIEQALNPLIAAAAPLFALATKVNLLGAKESPQSLLSRLTHELYSFECQARNQNFRTQTVLAARYAICALLDELISLSAWGQRNDWSPNHLLHTFYSNSAESEQFFSILHRANSDPGQHQELLEFYYLCLSLGYYGKYRQSSEAELLRQNMMDQLYQNLRRCRSEASKLLGINAGQQILECDSKKGRYQPWTWIAAIGLVVITMGVTYGYIHLKQTSAAFSRSLNSLNQPQTVPNNTQTPVRQ
jgi:type IV/VI secretion system ImpK/VasF family protein